EDALAATAKKAHKVYLRNPSFAFLLRLFRLGGEYYSSKPFKFQCILAVRRVNADALPALPGYRRLLFKASALGKTLQFAERHSNDTLDLCFV
ncbi:MAG: hypothetical protein LBE10_00385, partial [Treponema sp.]|nr:hypothetical protein [Treponema sp.]